MTTVTRWDIREIEAFVYTEARLADEHDYDAWEALWEDDAIYWVPLGRGHEDDPGADISIIFDHRGRISTRLKQLRTGHRHAQSPPSRTRRVVSNCELMDDDGAEATAEANFVIVEYRPRETQLWAGRTTYRLRRTGDGIRLVRKVVRLVNSEEPLPSLGFLI